MVQENAKEKKARERKMLQKNALIKRNCLEKKMPEKEEVVGKGVCLRHRRGPLDGLAGFELCQPSNQPTSQCHTISIIILGLSFGYPGDNLGISWGYLGAPLMDWRALNFANHPTNQCHTISTCFSYPLIPTLAGWAVKILLKCATVVTWGISFKCPKILLKNFNTYKNKTFGGIKLKTESWVRNNLQLLLLPSG